MRKNTKLALILSAAAMLTLGASFSAFAASGWLNQNGEWRYLDRDGYAVTDEWKKSGNDWYYINSDGYMAKNALINDGKNYYAVEQSGKMVTNQWSYLEDDGDFYWFYFQSNGKAKDNGFLTVDGQKYHFTDCKMDEGWLQDENNTYLLDKEHNGTYGAVKTGWVYVDDFDDDDDVSADEEGWYYFETTGKMVTNDEKKINEHYYVFDENGLMLDNWVEFTSAPAATISNAASSDSIYKYYTPGVGNRVNGWKWLEECGKDEGKETEEGWYYFKNGIPYTSEYKTTKIADGYSVAKINSKIYCFNKNGLMVTGKVDGENGKYYYFGEDENDGSMKYGKVKITDSDDLDEGTYYFDDKGSLGDKGGSVTGVVKGYLYNNGELVTAEDGMRYEIANVDGKDYMVSESGKVKTSGTVTDGDDTKWRITKDESGNYVITKVN